MCLMRLLLFLFSSTGASIIPPLLLICILVDDLCCCFTSIGTTDGDKSVEVWKLYRFWALPYDEPVSKGAENCGIFCDMEGV